MRTIEEKAIEYAESKIKYEDDPAYFEDICKSFMRGSDFAQRWIPVDEKPDTPKRDEEGILYSDDLLLKVKGFDNDSFYFITGCYVKANDDEFFDIYPEVSEVVNQEDITHYRYIDLK